MTGHAKTTKKTTQEPRTAQWTEKLRLTASDAVATCEVQDWRKKHIVGTPCPRRFPARLSQHWTTVQQKERQKTADSKLYIVMLMADPSWEFGWKHGESNIQWPSGLRQTLFFLFNFSPLNIALLWCQVFRSDLQHFFWNSLNSKPVRHGKTLNHLFSAGKSLAQCQLGGLLGCLRKERWAQEVYGENPESRKNRPKNHRWSLHC